MAICSTPSVLSYSRGTPKSPRAKQESSRSVQGGPKEGPTRVREELRVAHVLQTLCFKLFLRHPKKLHDDTRNSEDGTGMAQGGFWEGHVLK